LENPQTFQTTPQRLYFKPDEKKHNMQIKQSTVLPTYVCEDIYRFTITGYTKDEYYLK